MASLDQLVKYRADLESARYSDTRRVRDSNGEEIEFRSERELARALAAVNRDISNYSGTARTVKFITNKGL